MGAECLSGLTHTVKTLARVLLRTEEFYGIPSYLRYDTISQDTW